MDTEGRRVVVEGVILNALIRYFFRDVDIGYTKLDELTHCRLCLGVWVFTALNLHRGYGPVQAFLRGCVMSFLVHTFLVGVEVENLL